MSLEQCFFNKPVFPKIGHGDFTTSLFRSIQLSGENQQNFLSSPISLLLLLSHLLESNGPQGTTSIQICNVIIGEDKPCTPEMREEIHNKTVQIYQRIESAVNLHNWRIVNVSNGIFINKDFNVKSAFLSRYQDNAYCMVHQVDFSSNETYSVINTFVNKSTDGIIESIFSSSEDLDKELKMIIISVINFQAPWQYPFSENSVETSMFRLGGEHDNTKLVKMMRSSRKYHYYENKTGGYRVLIMNFQNPQFKFVVMLPIKDMDMTSLNKAVSGGINFTKISESARFREVDLMLPMFELKTKLDLKSPLQALGMRDIFDDDASNLSGISEEKRLVADKVQQDVVLKVDTNGVRAAAVTYMAMPVALSFNFDVVNFFVDQPFFCMILDERIEIPLFIARITDPND